MYSAKLKHAGACAFTAMPELKKKRKGFTVILIIFILLNAAAVIALHSQKISDAFTGEIAPRLSTAVSSVMNLIPTAVCEITLAAMLCFGVIVVLMMILLLFLHKHEKYRRAAGTCVKIALLLTAAVIGTEQIYDTAMMHSTPVRQPQTHSFDELAGLWNYAVTQINTLSTKVDRDENYHLIHRSDEEIRAAIDVSRQKLAGEYPRFAYAKPPVPKTSVFSPVVTKFGDSAYFITPWCETVFTIKTQNRSVYPCIYAHEYSHFSGYYREDEANYFAHLLCTGSDDPNVRYTAWLDVMNRIWSAVEKEFFGTEEPTEEQLQDPDYLAFCDGTVYYDVWLIGGDKTGNYKKFHEERGEENVVDEYKKEAELPESAANLIKKQGEKHFSNLKEQLGTHYYDGVVQLLLDHYADQLEPYEPQNLIKE